MMILAILPKKKSPFGGFPSSVLDVIAAHSLAAGPWGAVRLVTHGGGAVKVSLVY
jgi:hypothetical protein